MDPLIPNGQPAPDFELPDLNGARHRLSHLRGKIVLLNFWSAECPWAERADRELQAYLAQWEDKMALWTIAPNANEPPELLKQVAAARGLPIVLHDSQHQVTGSYGAQTTPHVFLVDSQGVLRYQGALDNRTFRQKTPTQFYVRDAIQTLLDGEAPRPDTTSPYGCTIVRHAGTNN